MRGGEGELNEVGGRDITSAGFQFRYPVEVIHNIQYIGLLRYRINLLLSLAKSLL